MKSYNYYSHQLYTGITTLFPPYLDFIEGFVCNIKKIVFCFFLIYIYFTSLFIDVIFSSLCVDVKQTLIV